MWTKRALARLARKAGTWLELTQEDISRLENQSIHLHDCTLGSAWSTASGILMLPFVPLGFWSQINRWRLYWADDPEAAKHYRNKENTSEHRSLFAERIAPARHQLEPFLIGYHQSPRRTHKKILFVTAWIPIVKDGVNIHSSRTIEMPNRRIPGPDAVINAIFYPGLCTHHLAERGYVRLGGREKEIVNEQFTGLKMPDVSKILPEIDRQAKNRANWDIAHYNALTDFGEDFSRLRDLFGNLRTEICHVGNDFIFRERKVTYSPGYEHEPGSNGHGRQQKRRQKAN